MKFLTVEKLILSVFFNFETYVRYSRHVNYSKNPHPIRRRENSGGRRKIPLFVKLELGG